MSDDLRVIVDELAKTVAAMGATLKRVERAAAGAAAAAKHAIDVAHEAGQKAHEERVEMMEAIQGVGNKLDGMYRLVGRYAVALALTCAAFAFVLAKAV